MFWFNFSLTIVLNASSQVTQLAGYFEPLIMASVGLASKLHDHQQQMTILDQTKTLAESALQMLYAAKEGGGNPKVVYSFTIHVDAVFCLTSEMSCNGMENNEFQNIMEHLCPSSSVHSLLHINESLLSQFLSFFQL